MKKKLITLLIVSMGFVFTQEFDVDGDLKVSGDIIFEDETTMNTAPSGYQDFSVVCEGGGTPSECDGVCAGECGAEEIIDCGTEGGFVIATIYASPGTDAESRINAYISHPVAEGEPVVYIYTGTAAVRGNYSLGTWEPTSISVPCVPNSKVKMTYSSSAGDGYWFPQNYRNKIIKWSY